MNAPRRRVEGFDYLYARGGSYEVRLQVPQALRSAVGKGELKRSLGGDFVKARRGYHSTVAELQTIIEQARPSASVAAPSSASTFQPTENQINMACYAHFRQMVDRLRGKAISTAGEAPGTSREARITNFRSMIEAQIDAAELEAWGTMSTQADWLCADMGWSLDNKSAAYEHLCRTMLRARIQAYRTELRSLEGLYSPDPEADPLFGREAPRPDSQQMTLGALVQRFEEAKRHRWRPSTEKNYVIVFRVIEEICGKDTPLRAVDNDFCVGVWRKLQGLPANFQKHPDTRGKPIAEAIEVAAQKGLPKISPATINGHLNKLAAIIRYGRDRGWIAGNPMEDIEEPDPIADIDKRDALSIAQLNSIFASRAWALAAEGRASRPSRYWAPLMALFSGARLSEICGQRVDEIIEERGVKAFHFRHRPGERELKNGKSRKVPIHPELIRLGLWEFVEETRKSGQQMLFHDVSRDKLGKWGDSTSKWFARMIDKLELQGRLLSFHSLRHSFEDALKDVDLHDTPVGNVITGRWSPGVSKNYGSTYTLTKLAPEIAKVRYPGLTGLQTV